MDLKKTKTSPKLCVKQQLLYVNLKKFFKNKTNIDTLLKILNGESCLSLRIIDWFVTNYTKKNTIILYKKFDKLKVVENSDEKDSNKKKTKKHKFETIEQLEQFNVFLKYKSQLKAYSKKHFDPFCRRNRINFFYNSNDCIVTTIGQLNFFKWAIDYNILEYINNNLEIIEKDMNINIKRDEIEVKKSKKKPIVIHQEGKRIRKKRRELSYAANNILNKHKLSITLEFE